MLRLDYGGSYSISEVCLVTFIYKPGTIPLSPTTVRLVIRECSLEIHQWDSDLLPERSWSDHTAAQDILQARGFLGTTLLAHLGMASVVHESDK